MTEATNNLCPRRFESVSGSEVFQLPENDGWIERNGIKFCSYCGSIHPAHLFEHIAAGDQLIPTDKDYKVYLRSDTVDGKFYFQHLSKQQKQKIVHLMNERKVNIGAPGYFYRLPFFMTMEKSG